MIFLAIDWGSVGLKAAQLLLSLSILVILHEFGHYITARWFKCRVDKFYLFFDPWFSLFKKKVGETEYGIGWLPLGGYVKIAGMVDESLDKEQLSLPPQPWEFRSKPAWQRLIIMLGGVTVNVILAFIIYAMILMVWGEKKIPSDSLKYGIAASGSAKTSFLSSIKQNSFSVYVLVQVSVINEQTLLDLSQAKLSDQAAKIFVSNPQQFITQYGDSFIYGLITGGEFFAVLEIESSTVSEFREIKASLNGKASYGLFSGSASGEFEKTLQKITSSSRIKTLLHMLSFAI
jgi:hypothetical protein